MPYMKNGKRDYRREYDLYHGKPEQIKNRDARNSARSKMEDKGVVHKGDGKDVDHSTPLSKGGSNSEANLRATSKSSNRSFSRNKDSTIKSQTSRRESRKGR